MSAGTEHIKTTFERNARAVSLRPAAARGTATTRVTLRDGLTCDVQDGAWTLAVDMSQKSGGDGSAPASIEPYRRCDGFPVPDEFVIASGRKPS